MSGGVVTRYKNILSQPLYNWLLQVSQQIVYMRSGFHISVFFYQYAFFINDERGTLDAHVFLSIHALFFHDAVQVAYRFLFIRKEREIKFILVAEIAVLFHAVAAYAKYGITPLLKFFQISAECLRFQRAPGSIVLRIEIKNHLPALVIGKGNILSAVRRKCE